MNVLQGGSQLFPRNFLLSSWSGENKKRDNKNSGGLSREAHSENPSSTANILSLFLIASVIFGVHLKLAGTRKVENRFNDFVCFFSMEVKQHQKMKYLRGFNQFSLFSRKDYYSLQ